MKNVEILFATLIATFFIIVSGCGGGSAIIAQKDGEVIRGELVLDSIPKAYREDEYRISQGDKLDVVFLFNKEFNQKEVVVRPDGRISLPYVGDLKVAGITVSSLDSILTEKYSEILKNPDISIIIRKFQPQVIYVLGEVKAPGGFPYEKGMTLLSAISLGRGVTVKGMVLRRIAPNHIVGIQIDLNELIGKAQFNLDIPLEPFDIVYVPKSKLSSVEDFSKTMYTILANPANLYIKGWNVANMKILFEFYKRTAKTL